MIFIRNISYLFFKMWSGCIKTCPKVADIHSCVDVGVQVLILNFMFFKFTKLIRLFFLNNFRIWVIFKILFVSIRIGKHVLVILFKFWNWIYVFMLLNCINIITCSWISDIHLNPIPKNNIIILIIPY